MRRLYYTLHSGKNSKPLYFAASAARTAVPRALLRAMLPGRLASLEGRADRGYILDRVDYYCKDFSACGYDRALWDGRAVALADFGMTRPKVYWYDAMRYARWFDPRLRWVFLPGDVNTCTDVPTVVKSRPTCAGNEMSVLMKLNQVRHFIFVNDKKRWEDKKDMAVFRGGITGPRRLANRKPFVERYFGRPMFDIGVLNREFPRWRTEKMTIREHLDYKFIMCLEGNDVASNLKWVMSSNSVAVMPRPRCETWFMEGRLVPGRHYIEVKPDFSDVEQRLAYYLAHPDEARQIAGNANRWVSQFRDRRRETLISLLVLDRYFRKTNTPVAADR